MTAEEDPKKSPGVERTRDELTTHQIAARASAGDSDSFGLLYERIAPAIYTWATLRIHPRFRGDLDPEDIVQEVWWRAMDAFSRFDSSKGPFRSWIFRIATNVLTDGFRRLGTRGELPNKTGKPRRQAFPEELRAQATSVAQSAARNEEIKRLIAAASQMDKDDQVLFVHCALEGLSAKQTAKITGLSVDAATKRWQRLRTRLRESPEWQSFLSALVQ